nr:hypothetical protein Iba_chr09eCG1070 [Ipomoea batatas]
MALAPHSQLEPQGKEDRGHSVLIEHKPIWHSFAIPETLFKIGRCHPTHMENLLFNQVDIGRPDRFSCFFSTSRFSSSGSIFGGVTDFSLTASDFSSTFGSNLAAGEGFSSSSTFTVFNGSSAGRGWTLDAPRMGRPPLFAPVPAAVFLALGGIVILKHKSLKNVKATNQSPWEMVRVSTNSLCALQTQ